MISNNFYEYMSAANPLLPEIPIMSFGLDLLENNFGWIPFDLSKELQTPYIATSPSLLAGYIHIKPNQVFEFKPNSAAVFVLLQEVISVWKYRVARVNQSQYRIPQVEWVLLLTGGVVTIGFTYFFRIESQIIQSLMTGLFTLIIAMNLYMVLLFSEPYAGNFQVSKRSLITIQAVMRGIYFDKSSKD